MLGFGKKREEPSFPIRTLTNEQLVARICRDSRGVSGEMLVEFMKRHRSAESQKGSVASLMASRMCGGLSGNNISSFCTTLYCDKEISDAEIAQTVVAPLLEARDFNGRVASGGATLSAKASAFDCLSISNFLMNLLNSGKRPSLFEDKAFLEVVSVYLDGQAKGNSFLQRLVKKIPPSARSLLPLRTAETDANAMRTGSPVLHKKLG